MKNSKKGSMELGVNSIVILIIALVVLGLAIGFIYNTFAKLKDKIPADTIDVAVTADADHPLVLKTTEIKLRRTANNRFDFSVFNNDIGGTPDETSGLGAIYFYLDCGDGGGFMSKNTVLLAPGDETGARIILIQDENNEPVAGEYSCYFQAYPSATAETPTAQTSVYVTITA